MKPAEAREAALRTLYQADQRRESPDTEELSERAGGLVTGVWADRIALDESIGAVSSGWRVERMPVIDRNILRIALWELLNRPDIPVAVVISEAVRLAKLYSTERSGGFVNGVLARLATERIDG
ncbi:MAG: transcription antitermination factor NusB [Acidimicrobiia bacterium]